MKSTLHESIANTENPNWITLIQNQDNGYKTQVYIQPQYEIILQI